jgi:acetyl-CoA decarbonylase/synthase complex subunit delta
MSGDEKDKPIIKFRPKLMEMISKFQELELEDVEIDVGELEIQLQPGVVAPQIPAPPIQKAVAPAKAKPTEIMQAEFTPLVMEYPGQIAEVKLGATKSEGGTRGNTIMIGGSKTPAFYSFEGPLPHKPMVALDVFDMEVRLPKAIRMHVKEVMGDTAAWAKLAVEKYGADLITVNLLSTDPLIKDASPAEATKTVEEVLQAVDVPLIIGGCGDPKKDPLVFEKVAEVAEGERVVFSSLTLDMSDAGLLNGVAKALNDHGHIALAFTALDLNRAKELNRKLYEFLPKDRILMDLTTAALGYGLEYSFTIHERARMAALMGDSELQHPVLSGSTNAWAAREAWMKMGPEWEPRLLRGPIWETITALNLLLAGVDLFMMMHPAAVRTMREVIEKLMGAGKAKPEKIADWVNVRM